MAGGRYPAELSQGWPQHAKRHLRMPFFILSALHHPDLTSGHTHLPLTAYIPLPRHTNRARWLTTLALLLAHEGPLTSPRPGQAIKTQRQQHLLLGIGTHPSATTPRPILWAILHTPSGTPDSPPPDQSAVQSCRRFQIIDTQIVQLPDQAELAPEVLDTDLAR